MAVNMASTTPSRPLRLEMGRVSSSVPSAISSTKLTQMIWVALLPTSQPPPAGAFLLYFSPCIGSFCTAAAPRHLFLCPQASLL